MGGGVGVGVGCERLYDATVMKKKTTTKNNKRYNVWEVLKTGSFV